jgi:hypothetical protein
LRRNLPPVCFIIQTTSLFLWPQCSSNLLSVCFVIARFFRSPIHFVSTELSQSSLSLFCYHNIIEFISLPLYFVTAALIEWPVCFVAPALSNSPVCCVTAVFFRSPLHLLCYCSPVWVTFNSALFQLPLCFFCFFFSMARQPLGGLGRLIFRVFKITL